MKYGYFDEKNKEYVIVRPDTPTPWMNYLGLDDYCALISNTAGGYSFHKDPRDKRILRYRYNNIPPDRPGRYIYLRDVETGEFWSCSWQPVVKPVLNFKYECRQGLGYTKIHCAYKGIKSELTYFVPLKENLEVWVLRLYNLSKKTKKIGVFSYAEFCLWQAIADSTDFQYTFNIANCICEDRIIYHLTNYYPQVAKSYFAYFGASRKIRGFDCDREKFIGPYRSESNPLALERGRSFNSVAKGGNPIGSHSLNLELKPRQEQSIIFVLGVEQSKASSKSLVEKFSSLKVALKEIDKIKANWKNYLSRLLLVSPDRELNTMVNTWNAYQCQVTFNWSRSASYYESGIGRGMGFRDSNQDCLGVLHTVPQRVRQRIVDLARNQFKNGSSYHQYFPLTKKGDKRGYSDDHLWLIVSTVNYIKESQDLGFLEQRISFADGGSDKLYAHLIRAVEYSFKNLGRHRLPLMGYADWNDCLNNMGPEAESVWVAQFLCFVLKELSELAGFLKRKKDSANFWRLALKMQKTINQVAWDGNWYVRAFDTRGKPVGSRQCPEGKIYLNTQSWAVLADIAGQKRLLRCMDAVKKYLDTPYGIMLLSPPYKTFNPRIGAIGTFSPGLKENGGIFCHANPWAMIAEVMLGRADKAFDYYKKIAPTTYDKIPQIHMTEPYIYSQYITGEASPEFGRARNSWLTGSATWNFIAATWYILGIRPDYQGLRIWPCIPKQWKGFQLRRQFREAIYDIYVTNPCHVSMGIDSIFVDAKKIEGNTLPLAKPGTTHRIDVTMGGVNAR